jgi:hypothetical protein
MQIDDLPHALHDALNARYRSMEILLFAAALFRWSARPPAVEARNP